MINRPPVYKWTAHPRWIVPTREAAAPATGPQHRIKCSDMAAMIGVSRHLYDRFLSIDPNIMLIFARGALPLSFSVVWRLEKARNKKYFSDGITDGKIIHIFPGLVNQIWPSLSTNSVKFFHSEMADVLSAIKDDPIRIFVSDATRSGNSLNVALNELNSLASRSKRAMTVFFEPVLDAATNPNLKSLPTWDVHGQKVLRPRLLSTHDYSAIESKPVRVSQFLTATIHYNVVPNLFTEDYKELLGGEIMRGWPIMISVPDSGQFVFLSDYGADPLGSAGGDCSAYRLPYYLAEYSEYTPSMEQWTNYAAQKPGGLGPGAMGWVVEALSQPSRPDEAYEDMLLSLKEPLSDAQLGWLGEYGLGRDLIPKVRVRLMGIKHLGVQESAVDYLRRVAPELGEREPNGDLDRILRWWFDTLGGV